MRVRIVGLGPPRSSPPALRGWGSICCCNAGSHCCETQYFPSFFPAITQSGYSIAYVETCSSRGNWHHPPSPSLIIRWHIVFIECQLGRFSHEPRLKRSLRASSRKLKGLLAILLTMMIQPMICHRGWKDSSEL